MSEKILDLNNIDDLNVFLKTCSDFDLCIYYINCVINKYQALLSDDSYIISKNKDVIYAILAEFRALKKVIEQCKEKRKNG